MVLELEVVVEVLVEVQLGVVDQLLQTYGVAGSHLSVCSGEPIKVFGVSVASCCLDLLLRFVGCEVEQGLVSLDLLV